MEAGCKNKSFILEPDDSMSLRRGWLCPGICNREKKLNNTLENFLIPYLGHL